MSPKLPRITADEVLRALRRDGWYESRQSGAHLVLRHPRKSGPTVVPVHSGKTLRPKTLRSILAQSQLTVDELIQLL